MKRSFVKSVSVICILGLSFTLGGCNIYLNDTAETSAVVEEDADVDNTENVYSTVFDNDIFTEISIKDIDGIKIGNATDEENGTGCTVIICEDGAPIGIDVRGGGPASRDTNILDPKASGQAFNAILLGGGSAYGLNATGGVMKYLEEKNIGFPVGPGVVPLVVQSDIFDLTCGSFDVRPDEDMGYKACEMAYEDNYEDGCVGAGTGATVGKLNGMEQCTKTGIGSYAVQIGDIKIGAVVVLNALGNVYDHSGKCIAGMRDLDSGEFISIEEEMYKNYATVVENKFTGNTTIGVIITNAQFDKVRLSKIASMAHNGYARSIRPVHTSADGDTIYAMSTGNVAADEDMIGSLSAEVMSMAIERAVYNAKDGYGYPAASSIKSAGE